MGTVSPKPGSQEFPKGPPKLKQTHLGYAPSGHWFLVELKLTKANKIRFSPHQIAFFVRHPKTSFVLVAGSPDPKLVRLYPGSRILELVNDGLRLEPLACGLAACVSWFESLGA